MGEESSCGLIAGVFSSSEVVSGILLSGLAGGVGSVVTGIRRQIVRAAADNVIFLKNS